LKKIKFSTSVLSRQQSSNTTLNQEQANSSSPNNKNLFYIEDHKDKGYVIFKLNRAPVNSLNLEFLTELNIQLEKFEESKDFKGVILTSNLPNIFSGGLDITEMYQCKPDRVRQFWVALQDFWLKLYGSNKIYIAAINVKL
jgi:3,2-trans-enoyl-CoA isomerase